MRATAAIAWVVQPAVGDVSPAHWRQGVAAKPNHGLDVSVLLARK